jgi:hypothetical protein
LPFDAANEGIFDRCRVLVEYQRPVAKTFYWVVQVHDRCIYNYNNGNVSSKLCSAF